VGTIVGLRRYQLFSRGKPKADAYKNPFFLKAKHNINKQRLISLNQRILSKPGAGEGFVDDSFHIQMSRGYCNVAPVQRPDKGDLHVKGPFYNDSPTAFFLGRLPFNYWRGRTVVFPMSYVNILAWYLKIVPDEVRKSIGSVDGIFCALPSYVNSFLTLSKFSRYNKGYSGNFKRKLLDVNQSLHRLHLPINVPKATAEDIVHAKVTLGTHPGIITRKIASRVIAKARLKSKRISKTDLVFWVANDLYNNWENISNGRFDKTIGTYCIGSREKIQKVEVGAPVESRPLWIPEMSDAIFGSTWLEVLKTYWQAHGLFKSEIWLGHSDTKMRYYRRMELDQKFKYSYEFDGQVWDSSVLPELIIKAFNIYASCFPKDKAVSNHFKFLCDTFVMKRVILHNGNTFLVSCGVPSGHAWTSHINSMCNWLLWTSTISNCPHIPNEFRSDYELQIQGDDVCIHSNVLLTDEVRHLICGWMLTHFNYVAVDDTVQPCKAKVKTPDEGSSFLKRYLDRFGNLTTKTKDVWKKLLFGADYSGTRKSRLTYLLRRVNDLAIIDEKQLTDVSRFIAFTDLFEFKFFNQPFVRRLEKHHVLFKMMFYLTDAFTDDLRQIWHKFVTISRISPFELIQRTEHYKKYMHAIYRKNYWTYDSKREYVDYWAERKISTTVGKALRNMQTVQIISHISLVQKLHGPLKKYKKRRKRLCTNFLTEK
jgi:hypothetical protein